MASKHPKPTAIKRAEGNRGKRPLPANEPQPQPGEPAMTPGLSAAAQKHWRRLCPLLLDMGVLTVADGDALGQLCEMLAINTDRLGEVRERRGNVNRRFAQFIALQGPLKRAMDGFGLDPSSRSRIAVAVKAKKEDEELSKPELRIAHGTTA